MRRSRLAMTIAAALAGGSVMTSCDTLVKEAVVGGTKNYLFTIFSPTNVIGLMSGDSSEADE